MFKVVGYELCASIHYYGSGEKYISKKMIQEMKVYTSMFQLSSFVRSENSKHKFPDRYPIEAYHMLTLINKDVSCECTMNNEFDGEYYECSCDLSKYFPIYVAKVDAYWYYIHPDEKEHVQRFMAGTDNPLYDLVDTLKFHPRYGFDPDVQAAVDDQEEKKRKIDKE